MTTNKPEVVAWRWLKPTVNDHGETVGGIWKVDGVPSFLPWWTNEPLIRLSDYEALQAECEKLVEALERARAYIDDCGAQAGAQSAIDDIDTALAASRKGGGQ